MEIKNVKISEREREREFKVSFFETIISLENLFLAWKEFKKGKNKKIDVQYFSNYLKNNIFHLHKELKNKIYTHSNYVSFYIKDPKLRHIHKACVKDRILHHAIFRVLYSIFDTSFIFDSYSCRLGKGTHRGVWRLQEFFSKESKNNTKTCWVLKCDIKKFFNSIDHEILLSLIGRRIKDKDVIWLVELIIKSFPIGLPLGNITSQLFANIYLNELDQFIKHSLKIKYYIRYCDDFLILNKDRIYLEKIIPAISEFLKSNLKLILHPNKIIIKKYRQGIDFLGYVSFSYHRMLRVKTQRRIIRKIKQKTQQLKDGIITEESFRQTINSYRGVLSHCNSYKIKGEIQKILPIELLLNKE